MILHVYVHSFIHYARYVFLHVLDKFLGTFLAGHHGGKMYCFIKCDLIHVQFVFSVSSAVKFRALPLRKTRDTLQFKNA